MEKAFDVADLVARLKTHGLEVAEEAATILVKEIFAWTSESCTLAGGLIAIIPPVLALAEPMVLAAVDKIDGKVG